MPYYSYQCQYCSHEFDHFSKIANRKDIEQEPCPNCLQLECIQMTITDPPIVGYNIAPGLKITDGFNDRLKEIKKRSGRDSTVGDSIK